MGQEFEKKKFEVKFRQHPKGHKEKAIFIDGEKLDYSIDKFAYQEVAKMGPAYRMSVQKDIERHFVESVSQFLKRNVTIEDIKKAITTGWI